MANRFVFQINVTCERQQGKFAGREELAAQIQEALEGADPGSLSGDNGGEYETTEWMVEEMEQPKPQRKQGRRGNADVIQFPGNEVPVVGVDEEG